MFDKPRIPIRAIVTEGMLPARAQRALYRRRGYRIAPDVDLSPGVVIEADEVDIGPGCSIGFGTVIRAKRLRLGRRVSIGSACFFEGRDIEIGDDTVIREQVFVGGPLLPDSLLQLGKRVRVFQNCFLNPTKPLLVGDDSGVGGNSSVFTHASWQSAFEGFPVTFAPIEIGRNVWLPWHVFILPGVTIGDNATISAGSVVMKPIPGDCLAAGIPARVMVKGDNWPQPIDADGQWATALEVLEELSGYLRGEGVDAQVTRVSDAESTLSLRWHGTPRTVRFWRGRGATAAAGDVVVLVGAPEDGLPAGVAWFDVLRRRKDGPSDPVTREVEEFLWRYGVRFAPADEVVADLRQ